MSLRVIIPRAAAANKPPHGQPCTRCGVCCMATLCPLGQHVFGIQIGPCPALTQVDSKTYVCGLSTHPEIERPKREAAALLTGAGTGCDARINGEPADAEFNARLLRQDAIDADRVKAAKLIWGGMP